MPVTIDHEKCGLCLGCATICPEQIFYFKDEQLCTHDGCTDCGLCIECCPVTAITET